MSLRKNRIAQMKNAPARQTSSVFASEEDNPKFRTHQNKVDAELRNQTMRDPANDGEYITRKKFIARCEKEGIRPNVTLEDWNEEEVENFPLSARLHLWNHTKPETAQYRKMNVFEAARRAREWYTWATRTLDRLADRHGEEALDATPERQQYEMAAALWISKGSHAQALDSVTETHPQVEADDAQLLGQLLKITDTKKAIDSGISSQGEEEADQTQPDWRDQTAHGDIPEEELLDSDRAAQMEKNAGYFLTQEEVHKKLIKSTGDRGILITNIAELNNLIAISADFNDEGYCLTGPEAAASFKELTELKDTHLHRVENLMVNERTEATVLQEAQSDFADELAKLQA